MYLLLILFTTTPFVFGYKYGNSSLDDEYDEYLGMNDVKTLAQQPLENLLKVKMSMDNRISDEPDLEMPEAMALSSNQDEPNRRVDKKHSKLTSFFSLSVTALSFLAFGGYLLCLIVQAVKNKQNYYINPAQSTPQPVMVFTGNFKRKPQFSYGRRKRHTQTETERMYLTLIKLAEGYAAWNRKV